MAGGRKGKRAKKTARKASGRGPTRGRGKGRSKVDPKAIKTADRQRRAMELRLAGHTLQEIADALGYAGKSGALKALEAGMAAIRREPAEQLIQVEHARLEALHRRLWERLQKVRSLADLERVARMLLKVSARRAKLLGLDAPTSHAVTAVASLEVDQELTMMSEDDLRRVLLEEIAADPAARDQLADALAAADEQPEGGSNG